MKKREIEETELNENVEFEGQSLFSRIKRKRQEKKQKRLEEIEKELASQETEQVKEQIEEVNKEIVESRSTKKKRTNLFYWIFNIVLILGILIWTALSTDDFTPYSMLHIDFRYVFVCVLFMALIIAVDVLSIHRMIYAKTLRSRWATSYKSYSIYKFTPLSTGGQPFMVSYLTSRDVPAVTALSIPMTKMLFQNVTWLIATFTCMIYSLTQQVETFISVASIIGFVLTLLLVVAILVFSVSKKFMNKVVSVFVRFMIKLRIWKDFDRHYNKIIIYFESYQKAMKAFKKPSFDLIYQFILNGARVVLTFSIPFFIYCAFKGYDPSMFGEFFVYTALIDLASHFIPLPNGTGINEITFTWLFARYLGGDTFWALLLWRFFTFYFYLLQGLCVVAYDTFYGNKKYRWIQTRTVLQKESEQFRKKQIENFRIEREKRRKKQKNNV